MFKLKKNKNPPEYLVIINGILIIIIFNIILFKSKDMSQFEIFDLLLILIFLGILFGISGILHFGIETIYGFNPLELLF